MNQTTNRVDSAAPTLLCPAFGATGQDGAGAMNWTTGLGMILTHWLWTTLGTLAQTVAARVKQNAMPQRVRVHVEHGIRTSIEA